MPAGVITAIWPIFMLIVAGYVLRRRGFPGEEFWTGAEQFNYFILFPALLFSNLATAPFGNPALPRLLAASLLALAVCCAVLLAARKVWSWPAARFGVMMQGAVRFNTYLGLAAVGGLYGKEGLALSAVVLALLVPVVNVLSVAALTADGKTGLKALAMPIVTNPLILSCAAGAAFNLSGIELKWGWDRLLALLAATSLPLGLLCVGAALKPKELHGEGRALTAGSIGKLLLVPAVALGCAEILGLPPLERTILVVFFALPTAPTAYVLTRRLGGDSHLMAGLITLQTLLSAVSLVVVLDLLGRI